MPARAHPPWTCAWPPSASPRLLDGLWLEWCLEPASFRPAEAIGLCEAWVDNLVRRTDGSALE